MKQISLQTVRIYDDKNKRASMISRSSFKSQTLDLRASRRIQKYTNEWGLPLRVVCSYGKEFTNEIVCTQQADIDYVKQAFIQEYLH
ncbi:MAG: hypothetical protein ACYC6W_11740 [Nitrosotalea sp.]